MLRTLFAMSVAGLLFSAIPQNTQAAPISPLSAGIAAHLVSDRSAVARSLLAGSLGPYALPYVLAGSLGRVRCR